MAEEFNPILNNPYDEPSRHYQTDIDGSLNYKRIIEGRRIFDPMISRKKTEHTLRIEMDPDAWDRLYGLESHPIKRENCTHKKIAVRVVSQFREECTKVMEV